MKKDHVSIFTRENFIVKHEMVGYIIHDKFIDDIDLIKIINLFLKLCLYLRFDSLPIEVSPFLLSFRSHAFDGHHYLLPMFHNMALDLN